MKVKISKYTSRLVCNIHTRHMEKKYGLIDWPTYAPSKGLGPGKYQPFREAFLEGLEDSVQWVYNVLNWIWYDRRTQKVRVRIDRWDTWSMDHTLASIVLPMLVQLKATKHGAPSVDNADVPRELRMSKKDMTQFAKDGSTDDKFFKRWDWILDEMIWAFEQKNRDHWEDDYYGPYIESEDKRELFGRFEWTDDKGRNAHQERMTNGFKLFGKYFEALWD
jgi:hypothetical protein